MLILVVSRTSITNRYVCRVVEYDEFEQRVRRFREMLKPVIMKVPRITGRITSMPRSNIGVPGAAERAGLDALDVQISTPSSDRGEGMKRVQPIVRRGGTFKPFVLAHSAGPCEGAGKTRSIPCPFLTFLWNEADRVCLSGDRI